MQSGILRVIFLAAVLWRFGLVHAQTITDLKNKIENCVKGTGDCALVEDYDTSTFWYLNGAFPQSPYNTYNGDLSKWNTDAFTNLFLAFSNQVNFNGKMKVCILTMFDS